MPVTCVEFGNRINLRAQGQQKWCYNIRTTNPETCDAYGTQNKNNGRARLCYNPIHPNVDPNVNCDATEEFVICPMPPPLPPWNPPSPSAPPRSPPPERRRQLTEVLDSFDRM